MRLIDADYFKAEVESLDAESNNRIYLSAMKDLLRFFVEMIDRQPTIEPKVRHGHWIWFESKGTFIHLRKCSECGDIKAQAETNFCPNCGAKMGEGE